MLYVKTTNLDGTLTVAPIRNNNIYQYCEYCRRFVPVTDLMELVGELSEADMKCETLNICEECMNERCELEDEYCWEHYGYNHATKKK